MNWVELVLVVVGALASILMSEGLRWVQSQFDRSVTAMRDRLRADVLGELSGAGPDSPPFPGSDRATTDSTAEAGPEADHLKEGTTQPEIETKASQQVPEDQRFAALLIEYYAYGLSQARRSFGVSLSCSVVGGLVLLSGIAMAIFRAETTGEQYASVTASVAGLLMSVIGTLFHRRADLALKHMESQTQSLRQDMKVERDAGQAIRLLEDVDDPALKAHLQAALILKFSAAQLPVLGEVLRSGAPTVPPSVNGTPLPQQAENPRHSG
ncbi:hypothetical protein [Streptomyces sp. NPDC056160]|uniref:TRADD-N-associated membrane domain-containing protein n=1 Tax=Streptomyces sp. NPDC056160 TaxID=3345731 RepID=UPI0035DCB309